MTKLFYGELNGTKLKVPSTGDAFTITKELCNIGYFEFNVANTAANRALIATQWTQDLYIYRASDSAEVFQGRIGRKRTIDRSTIQLSGHEWFIALTNEVIRYVQPADKLDPECVCKYATIGGSVDVTTEATQSGPLINVPFEATSGSIRIGYPEPFSSVIVEVHTPGVCSEHDLSYCYMDYCDAFPQTMELPVIDDSQGFTKPAGTYYIAFEPPPMWYQNSFCDKRLYYFYMRIDPLSSTPYTINPWIDRVWVGRAVDTTIGIPTRINPFRITFLDTAPYTILFALLNDSILNGFYISGSPSNINIRGDYQNGLQWIVAVANATTWVDVDGYEHPFEWNIDASHTLNLHPQILPGETDGDDSRYFTLLDTETVYEKIATRVLGLGGSDGTHLTCAYAEDYSALDIRELVISNPKFTNQNAFNSYIKKTLTGLKEAPEEITVEVATSGITGSFYGWIDNYALGQKVQIKQPEWGITDTKYRILRADIGPLVTRLELSTRKKRL